MDFKKACISVRIKVWHSILTESGILMTLLRLIKMLKWHLWYSPGRQIFVRHVSC